ncbi:DUF7006 family protein [Enterococcus mundtii]|uniref:DUF7006 family protein n=1 Tax=Enterococcus mundtii TaxID=53346 RepID=UPI002DB8C5FC|nr:hypothetical protein [Enterococcus mundtii]MEC3941410.1 hypothetical protein [Enterococcus mundtii]
MIRKSSIILLISKNPEIFEFYLHLRTKFLLTYHQTDAIFFLKLATLLDIDAQLQILLELIKSTNQSLGEELGMAESEIISMIAKDKKCFYRELTGLDMNHSVPWQLIYLSES